MSHLTGRAPFDICTFMEASKVVPALAALAQDTRLSVYRLLVEHAPEGLPAGQIAEKLDILPATLSFHLKELSHAGLVASRQESRFVWYRADLDAMNSLIGYLTENCCRASAACDSRCAPSRPKQPVARALPAARRRRAA
jgi:DNA-binding transcriptional ArsR family regulator